MIAIVLFGFESKVNRNGKGNGTKRKEKQILCSYIAAKIGRWERLRDNSKLILNKRLGKMRCLLIINDKMRC